MTPTQVKIAVYGGLALLAWLCTKRKQASGDVELGVGTVDGVFGGDYYKARYVAGGGGAPLEVAPPINPAVDQRMRELIDRSNAAIAEAD